MHLCDGFDHPVMVFLLQSISHLSSSVRNLVTTALKQAIRKPCSWYQNTSCRVVTVLIREDLKRKHVFLAPITHENIALPHDKTGLPHEETSFFFTRWCPIQEMHHGSQLGINLGRILKAKTSTSRFPSPKRTERAIGGSPKNLHFTKVESKVQASHKTFCHTLQLRHFVFIILPKGLQMFALLWKPCGTILAETTLLASPERISKRVFKKLIFKYPSGSQLKFRLVVPTRKLLTYSCVKKLWADIYENLRKEINVNATEKRDKYTTIGDKLSRERVFWEENFLYMYVQEHNKNKRLYMSQWTTEELDGKVYNQLKPDTIFALEIWIGGSALIWLTSLAFCCFTLSCNQIHGLLLQDNLDNVMDKGKETQFNRFMTMCSQGSIFDTETLTEMSQ